MSVVAQDAGGTLRGTVTFEANGTIVDNASVVIVQLGRTTQTAETAPTNFKMFRPEHTMSPPDSHAFPTEPGALKSPAAEQQRSTSR